MVDDVVGDYVTTTDLALDQVRTFADLLVHLSRLHVRAGKPTFRLIEKRTNAVAGINRLSRSKVSRILKDGVIKPQELQSFLFAHRVRPEDHRPWHEARGRADEQRHSQSQRPDQGSTIHQTPFDVPPESPSGVLPPPDTADIDQAARQLHAHLLAVRERYLRRADQLRHDLAHGYEQASPDADPVAVLARSITTAADRMREIIDEACAEIMTLTLDGNDEPPPERQQLDPNPEMNAGPPVWVAEVIKHVPLPILAALLIKSSDAVRSNMIAKARPDVMASLLTTLNKLEAAAWLGTWEPEAAAATLAAAGPAVAAGYLETMDPAAAARVLIHLKPLVAAGCLGAMRPSIATDHLIAVGVVHGVLILEHVEPLDVMATFLIRMHRRDHTVAWDYMREMDATKASMVLSQIDDDLAKQQRAREVLEKARKSP